MPAIAQVEFEAIEFEGWDGITRTFYGCSIEGIFEFDERVAELRRIVGESAEEDTIEGMYRRDKRFRFLCDRCLELNGISPKWVTLLMMEQLLFARVGTNGKLRQGWLIELNASRQQGMDAGEKPGTKARLIAALALQSGSLVEALHVARSEPAVQVLRILEEKLDLSLNAEDRQKRDQKDWAKEQRRQARQGMSDGR